MSTSTQEPISDQKQPEIASMEANSETQPSQMLDLDADAERLRNAALMEAKNYDEACLKADTEADRASWTLVYLMLKVVETFEHGGLLDEAAFNKFLTKSRAPKHGNSDTDYHRLAKACMPAGTKSPRISKLGGAIAAIRMNGIHSSTVRQELEKRSVVEGHGERSGVHRFFLLYRKEKLDKSAKDKKSGDAPNPYAEWTNERLVKQTKLILNELARRSFVPADWPLTIRDFNGRLDALEIPK